MKNKVEDIIIYQTKAGAIELRADIDKDTIWATQAQIGEVFEIDRSVVTKHIKNIFKDKEISEKSNVQKMHIAKSDKPVQYYSLDVILSIGYRTNSAKAILFRQWATKVLKSHIVDGFSINKHRLKKNYEMFLAAVENVKKLLPEDGNVGTDSVLDLVKMFATTWFSLDAYDKGTLPKTGVNKKQFNISGKQFVEVLIELRNTLIEDNKAGDLFGREREVGAAAGIIGNVFQSFGGNDLYPTLEEKAAHLLYFVIKNHPFLDGNKRSGAFAFVWFLRKAGILNISRFTPEALTVLTLLVAESKASDKERMIGLILMLLKK